MPSPTGCTQPPGPPLPCRPSSIAAFPRWRKDNFQFRYAIDVPLREIEKAHAQSKRTLIEAVAERTGITLRSNVFTIGFARRVATYKRADLLLTDPERLVQLRGEIPRHADSL